MSTNQGVIVRWAIVNGVLSFAIYDCRIPSFTIPNPMIFDDVTDPAMIAAIVAAKGQAVDVTTDETGHVVSVKSVP